MIKKWFDGDLSWIGYTAAVLLLHAAGAAGLIAAAGKHPELWGLGLLAYTLGLRHAFDVDHIAAIDNTVRKLTQQKRSSLGVGFYFSLGHSSVVFLLVLAVALSMQWVKSEMPQLQEIGGLIGASVSGGFLLIIGMINLFVLFNLFSVFRQMLKKRQVQTDIDKLLDARGFFVRLTAPLLRFIGKSWHVYPLGFLFGLGFDTATEVGLLAMSAGAVSSSMPIYSILAFPILFAAGMSLMDTADGMFMTKAYRWALSDPLRKLYYNITVTLVAVVAALLIGLTELTQVISTKLGLHGAFWSWLDELDFNVLGYALVGVFIAAWAASALLWRLWRPNRNGQSADA